jgi:uncharacterized membrane protein
MDTKKFLLATVAGGLTFLVVGFVFWGLLFDNFFEANQGSATGVGRADDEMIWWALILANLLMGALITYIFMKWAGIKTFMTGAMAGLLLGFLMTAGFDLVSYAATNMRNLTAVAVDILLAAIMTGIGSGVIGAVLGMGKK